MSDLHIVEDTSPQLGGDLDLNGHLVAGATAAEIGCLSGVSSAIQTQLAGTEKTANKNQPYGYAGLDANGDLVGTLIPRSGTAAEIGQIVLLAGEVAYCTDTGQIRIGDGTTAGGVGIVPRSDTAANINLIQLRPGELAFCTDTHDIRVGDGQTLGGIGMALGGSNFNFGAVNTTNTAGYPLRPYTSSDGLTAVIAGGDYTAEFADAQMVLFSGGSQTATTFSGASYDSQSDTTTVTTGGGLGANGSIAAFPGYSAACGVGCAATGAVAFAANAATTASGTASHAEGGVTTASGSASHAEGGSTTASGGCSHAEGFTTLASGGSSHAEGVQTTASGSSSHAEGSGTMADGVSSHAEGEGTTASSTGSHAEGSQTTASGDYSHAEGSSTTASGGSSHAEGGGTTADGDYSHAEGSKTTASGDASHAEGSRTTASGDHSHAEGMCTTASGEQSHAEGVCSNASKSCQRAIASGSFNGHPSTTQHTEVVVRCETTDATPTALLLRNFTPTEGWYAETTPTPYTCDASTTYACLIHLAARKDDGTSAMFLRQVVVKNVSGTQCRI